jgi:hypothetical protein
MLEDWNIGGQNIGRQNVGRQSVRSWILGRLNVCRHTFWVDAMSVQKIMLESMKMYVGETLCSRWNVGRRWRSADEMLLIHKCIVYSKTDVIQNACRWNVM